MREEGVTSTALAQAPLGSEVFAAPLVKMFVDTWELGTQHDGRTWVNEAGVRSVVWAVVGELSRVVVGMKAVAETYGTFRPGMVDAAKRVVKVILTGEKKGVEEIVMVVAAAVKKLEAAGVEVVVVVMRSGVEEEEVALEVLI